MVVKIYLSVTRVQEQRLGYFVVKGGARVRSEANMSMYPEVEF